MHALPGLGFDLTDALGGDSQLLSDLSERENPFALQAEPLDDDLLLLLAQALESVADEDLTSLAGHVPRVRCSWLSRQT